MASLSILLFPPRAWQKHAWMDWTFSGSDKTTQGCMDGHVWTIQTWRNSLHQLLRWFTTTRTILESIFLRQNFGRCCLGKVPKGKGRRTQERVSTQWESLRPTVLLSGGFRQVTERNFRDDHDNTRYGGQGLHLWFVETNLYKTLLHSK